MSRMSEKLSVYVLVSGYSVLLGRNPFSPERWVESEDMSHWWDISGKYCKEEPLSHVDWEATDKRMRRESKPADVAELDPDGLSHDEPGAKTDKGKPLAGTVLRGFGPLLLKTNRGLPDFCKLYLSGAKWIDIAKHAIRQRDLGGIIQVGDYGAHKYSPGGWRKVNNAVIRYDEAFGRHLSAYMRGEIEAQDSKLPHLWHCAWNACACATFEIEGEE